MLNIGMINFRELSQKGWEGNGGAFRPMNPSQVVCHYCQEKGHIAHGYAKKVTDNYKRRRENEGTKGVVLIASLYNIDGDERITNTTLLTWYVDSAASNSYV